MSRNELTALGLLLAAFIGGAALAAAGGESKVPWYISRASGVGAFVALSLSVILGLLTSMRLALPGLARAFNYEIHGFVSVLGLTLVGVHGGALLFDSWFHFTPAHLLIPFIAPYEPLWTGLGTMAAWGMAVVTASFWMRRWIGQRTWRRLHYVSFGVYLLGFFHGVFGGTDTGSLPVALLYAASIATVASLLALRIMVRTERAARPGEAELPPVARSAPAAAPLWFGRADAAADGQGATNSWNRPGS
ncbi:MAG: hypothetical protein AB7T37_08405 [Dehalococcoidia bacterium]